MNVNDVISDVYSNFKNNSNFWKHKNMLIIGQNSAGKSKIIKDLINLVIKEKDSRRVYFIDSRNRTLMKDEQDRIEDFSYFTPEDILNERIKKQYFNNLDIFSNGKGTEIVYSELLHNFEKYKQLFEEILEVNIDKQEEEEIGGIESFNNTVIVNDEYEINNISNGEAAMMRILMEVENANNNNCSFIIIDEFDAHLDNDNLVQLIRKLTEKYNEVRFAIVIHSEELAIQLNDFDVVFIKKGYDSINENNIMVVDSNEISTVYKLDKIMRKE